jgi:polar amino acid transport system substrate-binding protein
MRINWHILVWVLLLSLTSQSEPSSPPYQQVIIGADEWPEMTNKDGTGFIFELLRTIYEPLDIKLSNQFMPWKRTLHQVAVGKADITLGVHRDALREEERRLLISDYPLIEEHVSVVFLASKVQHWRGQQSLTGEIVAVIRGFDIEMYLKPKITPYYVNDYDQALRMLIAGRVTFVAGEQLLTDVLMPKYIKKDYELSQQRIFSRLSYVALAPNERGKQFLQLYTERMAQLLVSGELQAIYRKWGWEVPPMPLP